MTNHVFFRSPSSLCVGISATGIGSVNIVVKVIKQTSISVRLLEAQNDKENHTKTERTRTLID